MSEAEDSDEEMLSPTKERRNQKEEKDHEMEDTAIEDEEQQADYSSKIRKALFAAVEGGQSDDDQDDEEGGSLLSHRPLVRLFEPSNISRTLKAGANATELKELLLETVENFHKGFARRFFSGIKPILEHLIQEEIFVPESAFEEGEDRSQVTERSTAPEDITPDAKSSEALHFLLYTTYCLHAYLESVVEKHSSSRKSHAPHAQPIPMIAEASEVARLLHDLLFDFRSCGPDAIPVETAVLKLCESWWHANVAQRDTLVPMALTIMALKAQPTEGKPSLKSDIKRLLKMQDAFHVIEWTDESSKSLQTLLQKIVSNPQCLKSNEGKKFLSGLFLIDADLIIDLHQAIRIQIPQAKKDVLACFGDIYKRAWKDSLDHKIPEEIQQSIEENVLQDLMYAVLHVADPKMTKKLLIVLEPFHEAKRAPDVENLLYRMYGPILWRALSAANEMVRINAATVVGEVFPLPEPSHAQADAALHRGAEKLLALLQDNCPKVRIAGSETVAKVLTNYWDVLATDDIRSLLNREYIITVLMNIATLWLLNIITAPQHCSPYNYCRYCHPAFVG
jgi:condensin-2 complex subunit G2